MQPRGEMGTALQVSPTAGAEIVPFLVADDRARFVYLGPGGQSLPPPPPPAVVPFWSG